MQTTGRFWPSMGIVAGAGLVIALASHVGTWTKGLRLRISPGTFVLAFLPALVVGGWILVATPARHGWQEGSLDSWSNSIGILGVVHSIGLWHGVLAFGLGLVLGLSFDAFPLRSRRRSHRRTQEPTCGGRARLGRAALRRPGRTGDSACDDSHRRDDADADASSFPLTPGHVIRGRRSNE